jgi:hypothetical protein
MSSSLTTTEKAQHLLLNDAYNKVTLSEILGVSRPTLNTRLEIGNWKKLEVRMIDNLYNNATGS